MHILSIAAQGRLGWQKGDRLRPTRLGWDRNGPIQGHSQSLSAAHIFSGQQAEAAVGVAVPQSHVGRGAPGPRPTSQHRCAINPGKGETADFARSMQYRPFRGPQLRDTFFGNL
jgi:hypothetical protein